MIKDKFPNYLCKECLNAIFQQDMHNNLSIHCKSLNAQVVAVKDCTEYREIKEEFKKSWKPWK